MLIPIDKCHVEKKGLAKDSLVLSQIILYAISKRQFNNNSGEFGADS